MEPRKPSADSIQPPKKQFLTDEQLQELWDARGMKYSWDDLHRAMLARGLAVYVDRPMFRKMVHDILTRFLVEGDARVEPKYEPKTRWPKVH